MSFSIEKSSSDDGTKWMKRKRTQRHCNINNMISKAVPPAPVMTSSTSSSVEFSGITTEEEEMDLANSLILLSRGGNLKDRAAAMKSGKSTSAPLPFIKIEAVEKMENSDMISICQLVEATAQSDGNDFPCKTCNKRFNSFQALGGHRASHKKPKLDEQMVQSLTDSGTITSDILKIEDITKPKDEIKVKSPAAKTPAVHNVGGKVRAHICQICNAEFNSGQALGGHMRRHKPLNVNRDAAKNKMEKNALEKNGQEKNGLELDLNFPPMEQVDTREQRPAAVFTFEGSPPTQLSLGSPALSNCLYS